MLRALAGKAATKKRKSACKVAPVFAIHSASQAKSTLVFLSRRKYIEHSSHDLIPATFFSYCISSLFIIKIANLVDLFIPRANFHIQNCRNHIRDQYNQLINISGTLICIDSCPCN